MENRVTKPKKLYILNRFATSKCIGNRSYLMCELFVTPNHFPNCKYLYKIYGCIKYVNGILYTLTTASNLHTHTYTQKCHDLCCTAQCITII